MPQKVEVLKDPVKMQPYRSSLNQHVHRQPATNMVSLSFPPTSVVVSAEAQNPGTTRKAHVSTAWSRNGAKVLTNTEPNFLQSEADLS